MTAADAPSTWSNVPGRAGSTTEEERAYFQRRLSLYALVCALVSFGFWLAGFILGYTVYFPQFTLRILMHPASLFHEGATLLAAGLWLATRRGRVSPLVLAWCDAIGTVVLTLLFALMGATIPSSHGWVQALMAITLLLMLRAVTVPSSGLRTLVISTFAAVAANLAILVVASDRVSLSPKPGTGGPAFEIAMNTSLWLAAAIAVTTFASRIIFGLRQAVRSARQIGQYVLKHQLGEGGMGVVYLATHAMLRRETAIKLLLPSRIAPAALARFEREVQQLARLAHPNTVAIYDYGRTPEGVFYYAMEYLDGLSLDELVAAIGPLPAARVVHILDQICASLTEAHAMGLVHRDIKPANVILSRRAGIPDAVKVLDFGLVKDLSAAGDASVTAGGSFLGTPQYASPEAIQDPESVTAVSDLYAVAAVGYYLLTGTHVFSGATSVEVCAGHLYKAPEPPSRRLGRAVPQPLENLLLQGLAKRPLDRPANAEAFRQALRACADIGEWTEADAQIWWQAQAPELLARLRHKGQETPVSAAQATVAIDLNDR